VSHGFSLLLQHHLTVHSTIGAPEVSAQRKVIGSSPIRGIIFFVASLFFRPLYFLHVTTASARPEFLFAILRNGLQGFEWQAEHEAT